MSRGRKKSSQEPAGSWDRVFDTERLARWERDTVVFPTPDGVEYLMPDGGVLFVPADAFDV